MKSVDYSKELNQTVINNNYCIGCGSCTAIKGSPFKMELNDKGQYQAVFTNTTYEPRARVDKVCPFSGTSDSEDEISQELFNTKQINDPFIGHYEKLYAGYVNEEDYRLEGSSGGFGTWIAKELLQNKLVDAVIHVSDAKDGSYKYRVSHSLSQLKSGAGSKYFPIEMSGVLEEVKNNNKKYLLIAIPCFIKAFRLLSKQEKLIKDRIVFSMGLVCGHLKSSYYSKMISWDMGVNPSKHTRLNFRKKTPDRNADDYSSELNVIESNELIIRRNKEIFGTKWGYGFFKYNSCDFCDDVMAETADITIGDAWLPEYINDYLGTNIIVLRNKNLEHILTKGLNKNKITLFNETKDNIFKSQAGGFRHRRDGLAYRLFMKIKKDEWVPKKRVKADVKSISLKRRLVYRYRALLVKKSFTEFNRAIKLNSFNYFKLKMSFYLFFYRVINRL